MPEAASTEFWRDLVPITKVFQPDAKPEVYLANAPTDDERYYVPITDTVSSRPLFISPTENRWCDILMAKSAGLVNRHYHPHQVFAFALLGQVGLSRARLDGSRRRLRLRDAGRGPYAGGVRVGGADARLLQRRGAADLARRAGRGGQAISTSTTTSRCARSTTRRSGSAPTTWSRCSADHAGTSMTTFPTPRTRPRRARARSARARTDAGQAWWGAGAPRRATSRTACVLHSRGIV